MRTRYRLTFNADTVLAVYGLSGIDRVDTVFHDSSFLVGKWATLIHPPYSIFSKESGGFEISYFKTARLLVLLFGCIDTSRRNNGFFIMPLF